MAITMPHDTDAIFTYEDFDRRYNSDLANDLGNALNRSLAMAHKFVGGVVPSAEPEPAAFEACAKAKKSFDTSMEEFRINAACQAGLDLIRFLNKYIDDRAPWALAKANDPALPGVLFSMLLCLRAAEGLVRPIMPSAAVAIAKQLGHEPITSWAQIGAADSLIAGTTLGQPEPMFPRLDLAKEEQKPKVEKQTVAKETKAVVEIPEEITIDQFAKIQLRVARIFEAEPLEGSDKLMKLQVVIGSDRRQIIAGIRKMYSPEDLIGRQIVVVANLKAAKLRGADSQGMVLAAVDENGDAILLQPEKEAPEGAIVR